jgi:hypothetical protein
MGVRLRSQGGTKVISLIKLDFGEVQRLSQDLEKGTAPCGRVAQGKVPRLQIDKVCYRFVLHSTPTTSLLMFVKPISAHCPCLFYLHGIESSPHAFCNCSSLLCMAGT